MIDTYLVIRTVCLATFLGIVEIAYYTFSKKDRETKALETFIQEKQGVQTITRWELLKRKLLSSSLYKNYYEWLKKQMYLSWEEKETPDSIIHSQGIILFAGLCITLALLFIAPPIIAVIAFLIFFVAGIFPALNYKNKVTEKNKKFDAALPGFINKTIMVMKVGVSMENSFAYALQSMDESLTRKEFEKLVAEMKVHGDDIQNVFLNLNKRVQTEECERFCNIIVSGLKNGNKMSDILESEYERISDNLLADMKKEAENKKTLATIINILLIFVPAILLLVIPMMRIGELA